MQLNALHIRFGLIGAGVVLLVGYLIAGGSLSSPEVIQLDFSMYPEVFEGCDVEIDGQVVGQLEPYGRTMRAGFEVKKGRHVVRVLHEEFDSVPLEVDVSKPGQKARLMLDLVEQYDDGRIRTAIAMQ